MREDCLLQKKGGRQVGWKDFWKEKKRVAERKRNQEFSATINFFKYSFPALFLNWKIERPVKALIHLMNENSRADSIRFANSPNPTW